MNNKNKKPLNKCLVRSGKSWWEKIGDQWINCIPYNKKEEAEEKPQGGSDLNTQQFNKIMERFDKQDEFNKEIKQDVSELNTKVDNLETKVDNLETKVDNLETKVDKNTSVLKKHFPEDFK